MKVTVGFDVYPLPLFVTLIAVIVPSTIVAVPSALIPYSSSGLVNSIVVPFSTPEPPLITSTFETPPILAFL